MIDFRDQNEQQSWCIKLRLIYWAIQILEICISIKGYSITIFISKKENF